MRAQRPLPAFAPRLDKLYELRRRLDAEIADEEKRVARVDRAARELQRDRQRQQRREERERWVAERPPANVVRAWALENGIGVGLRGRVSDEVYELYERQAGNVNQG